LWNSPVPDEPVTSTNDAPSLLRRSRLPRSGAGVRRSVSPFMFKWTI
jgi:hypothetical protein